MKMCNKCGRILSLDEFYYRKKEGKYISYCHNCERKRRRVDWRRRMREPESRRKLRACARLKEAVRKDKLKRGSCYFCGSTDNIDGHHEDYDKPFEVIWLCRDCHVKLHQIKRSETMIRSKDAKVRQGTGGGE